MYSLETRNHTMHIKCVFIHKLYNTVKGTENYGVFHFSISVGMILVCLFSVHTDTF